MNLQHLNVVLKMLHIYYKKSWIFYDDFNVNDFFYGGLKILSARGGPSLQKNNI